MIRYILLQKYRFNNIYHYYNIINIKYILYFYQQEILEISINKKRNYSNIFIRNIRLNTNIIQIFF